MILGSVRPRGKIKKFSGHTARNIADSFLLDEAPCVFFLLVLTFVWDLYITYAYIYMHYVHWWKGHFHISKAPLVKRPTFFKITRRKPTKVLKSKGCKDGDLCTHCHICRWTRYGAKHQLKLWGDGFTVKPRFCVLGGKFLRWKNCLCWKWFFDAAKKKLQADA